MFLCFNFLKIYGCDVTPGSDVITPDITSRCAVGLPTFFNFALDSNVGSYATVSGSLWNNDRTAFQR